MMARAEVRRMHVTSSLKELLSLRNVLPFYKAAGLWLILGFISSGTSIWFAAIALAICLNLFLLLKTVATLLVFVSHKGRSGETVSSTNVAFWFAAKFLGFGFLLAVLLVARDAPVEAVLLGSG